MKTVVNFRKGWGKFQLRVIEEEAGIIGGGDDEAEAEICGTLPSSSSPRTPECEKYPRRARFSIAWWVVGRTLWEMRLESLLSACLPSVTWVGLKWEDKTLEEGGLLSWLFSFFLVVLKSWVRRWLGGEGRKDESLFLFFLFFFSLFFCLWRQFCIFSRYPFPLLHQGDVSTYCHDSSSTSSLLLFFSFLSSS